MNRGVILALVAVAVTGGAVVRGMQPKTPSAAAPVAASAATGDTNYPTEAFEAQTPPPAPDYAQESSWAALPDKVDFADRVPADNALPDAQARADVDVFYIQPTTLRPGERWSQDVSDAATNTWTDVSVTARQAAIFNACCRIYSPRYRQAALGGPGSEDERVEALDLAYEDVRRAFAYYMAHYNKGRPFILVGHSQGTYHLMLLLEQAIDQTERRGRLVAAYAIGIHIPVGTFGRALKNITICATPDQTGCVVSWNTFGPGGDAGPRNALAAQTYVQKFRTEKGKETLCVNPLTFDLAQPDAPKGANLGALPGLSVDAPLPAVKPGVTGATCREGGLYVDIPTDPAFVLRISPGEVLHRHDMDLFYQNIRANAVIRTQAWAKAHPSK